MAPGGVGKKVPRRKKNQKKKVRGKEVEKVSTLLLFPYPLMQVLRGEDSNPGGPGLEFTYSPRPS
jgi:hypothetical protein